MKRFGLLLLISAFASSCIWEERDGCPTYLSIDFSQTPEEVKSIILMLRYEDGYSIIDTIPKKDYMSMYEIPVKRGSPYLSAYGNIEKMVFDDGFTVVTGEESDDIYTDFRKNTYDRDLSNDTIILKKNNIGLYIRVLTAADSSYSVEITTECSGIGYSYSGEIIEGKFCHTPVPSHYPSDTEEYYEFRSRIVRQKNADAMITIRSVSEDNTREILEIPLSDKLDAAGMDLCDNELKDLYITINHSLTSMMVSVEEWNREEHIEIEI